MIKVRDTRNMNIEILRVVAMLMIIVGHSIGHTSLMDNMKSEYVSYYLVSCLQVFCYVATNIYVMISGYLLCEKTFKAKRVVTLWAQVAFYSILFYALFGITGHVSFSFDGVLKAILPISGNQYWFARVYFGLYLLMPFLNIFVHAMSQKQYQAFMLISIVLFSLWRSFLPFAVTLNSEGGNSIIWFIVLYMFAAYIRLYGIPLKLEKTWILTIAPVCLLLFSFATRIAIGIVSGKLGFGGKGTSLFTEFTSFPMLFAALLILMFAVSRSDRIGGGIAKIVRWFSSSSFSVYLIHENQYLKKWLWDFIDMPSRASNQAIILLIIGIAFGILVTCTCIDKILFMQFQKILENFEVPGMQRLVDIYLYNK